MRTSRLARGLLAFAMTLVTPACGPGTTVNVGVGVAYPGVGVGVAYPGGYWPGTPMGGVWVGGPVYR